MQSATGHKKKPSVFRLEKWYLDVVTPEGEACIFYAAMMKWRRIKIPYKSLQHIPAAGEPVQKSKFQEPDFPAVQDDLLSWNDPALKAGGHWQARVPPLQATLFETEEGALYWNCVQPVSRVQCSLDNRPVSGFGYAEQLILTLEPWKMPVAGLKWGRFCSEKNQLLWIEIRHDTNAQWVWLNGERVTQADINTEQVWLPEQKTRLKLKESRPAGKKNSLKRVMQKLFRYIPGFRQSVPGKFLLSEEQKWISKGQLFRDDALIDEGWVIHEEVIFTK